VLKTQPRTDFRHNGLLWQGEEFTKDKDNLGIMCHKSGLRSYNAFMSEADWDEGIVPDDQPPTHSDHVLLEQFRKGQMDASTRLYLKYVDRLLGMTSKKTGTELARKIDPEDIVQSVFRTFFRRVEEGLYDVPEGEDIWKLLLVIGLNKIRTLAVYHKAAKRDLRRTRVDSSSHEYLAQSDERDEMAFASLKIVIDDVMSDMLDVNRQIITQRIEGYEVSEIAANVNRSKRTVERVLQDFRTRLAKMI
jgi:RNA polymerase sigma-70 factor (ECF subfamily)